MAIKNSDWPDTRASLIQRIAKSGDVDAWKDFCNIYYPLLLRHCRRLGIQSADADDIIQEVLVRIMRYGCDPHKGYLRGWLCKVLKQCIYQAFLNKGKPIPAEVSVEQLTGGVDAEWIADFNNHVLKTAISCIRDRYDDDEWEAFELTWMQDKKPSDAAEQMGRGVSWVYRVTYCIRQDLMEAVLEISDDSAI